MQRVQGNTPSSPIECTNPIRNKWRFRWDFTTDENGNTFFMEHELDHKPSPEEIKAVICGWINERTNERILSGFIFEGDVVWLSTENQFNYKAAYDLAVQTAGASLPVTFKLGADDAPHYRTFEDVESLSRFYTQALQHVQDALREGWEAKDSIDLNLYSIG